MKRQAYLGWLVLCGVAIASFGCGEKQEEAKAPLLIGYLADTSDVTSTQARTAGMLSALRHINDEGGVVIDGKSHPLDLVVVDHGKSPAGVLAALERLEEQGVTAAVGPNWSSLVLGQEEDHSDGAALLARDREIVLVSGSASAAAISDLPDDGYFSRTFPSDAIQGVVGAEALIEQGITTAAVIARDDAWGSALAATFSDAFEELGGTVVTVEFYDSEEEFPGFDFSPHLDLLFAEAPEALYVASFDEFASLANQTVAGGYLDDYGDEPPLWFGADGIYSGDLGTNVPEDILINLAGTVGGSDQSTPGYEVMREIAAEGGIGEENLDGPRFDAVYLIALAMQAAGSTEGSAIRDSLGPVSRPDEGDTHVLVGDWKLAQETLLAGGGIDFEGASGEIDLDENGDRTKGVMILWYIEADGEKYKVNSENLVPFEP